MPYDRFRPFRITIHLATPPVFVGAHHFPTLDAVLAAARFRETNDLDAMMDIPILCEDGLYHASCAFMRERIGSPLTADASASFVRAIHVSDLDIPAGCFVHQKPGTGIETERGDFKSLVHTYTALTTDGGSQEDAAVLSYYGFGDARACSDLLWDYLIGIGKKGSRGHGEFARKPDYQLLDSDRSLVMRGTGMPARPVPLERWMSLEGANPGAPRRTISWRPPYFVSKPGICAAPALLLKEVE